MEQLFLDEGKKYLAEALAYQKGSGAILLWAKRRDMVDKASLGG